MQRYFARLAISSASLVIATFIAVAAFIALWAAVYLALAQSFAPAVAALLTGVGALLFAALVVVCGGWVARQQTARRRHAETGRSSAQTNEAAAELGRLLGNQLHVLTHSNAQGATLAALVAGFAVGASPSFRNFLRDIVAD